MKLAGAPVTNGRIEFHPNSGGRPALGAIGSDGTYQLTTFDTGDGALLGSHRVTITATKTLGTPPPKSLQEEAKQGLSRASRLVWLVPEKYSDPATTELTADVKDCDNRIDFNVPE